MLDLLAQTDPSQTNWVEVTRDLGFPIAIALLFVTFFITMLGGLGAVFWRIGVWLAPMVERAVGAHVTFVDTSEKNNTRQTMALESLADTQRLTESRAAIGERALEGLVEVVKKNAETNVAIQKDMSQQTELLVQMNDKIEKMPQMIVNVIAPDANKIEHHEHK